MSKTTSFGFSTTAEEASQQLSDQIKGKVILITGPTWGGIGAEGARVIVKQNPQLVILAGRKQENLDETIAKIKEETPNANLRPLILDLGSLESVRHAAAQVNAYEENIDVLINNAAVMASAYYKTVDGFEGQFGTNHLGPFLFTNLILPKILSSKTGKPRIVNVSSSAHTLSPIRFSDVGFSNGETYDKWLSYGQSKTANMLFAKGLSNRYSSKGLVTFSLHPGSIATNLARHIDLGTELSKPILNWEGNDVMKTYKITQAPQKTLGQGASTTIVAAFDPSIESESGSFLVDAQLNRPLAVDYALDDDNANKLWELSEQLVGEKFSV